MFAITRNRIVTALAATAVVGGASFVAPPHLGTARDLSAAFRSVAASASPAVVSIRTRQPAMQTQNLLQELPAPFRHLLPFGNAAPMQMQPNLSQGSGFVIDQGGLILTNNHVVQNADDVQVRFQDGKEYRAKVVGTDRDADLALLKVDAKDLPCLQFADSDDVQVGDWVLAIGDPFGLQASVTAGIISAKGRDHVGIEDYENFIQTDAAINPGNSGGPLLDLDGKVVGVNTAILSRSGGSMGIGFAIPANLARDIGTQLRTAGHVERGQLGVVVQNLTPELADSMKLADHSGALVADVRAGTAAAAAGLRAGDLITALDGKAVATSSALRNRVAALRPGTEIKLDVLRDGKPITVTATVGQRSADAEIEPASATAITQRYGFEVGPTDPRALGVEGRQGVVIRSIADDGAAAAAGLQPGTIVLAVGRTAVHDVKDFDAAVAAIPPGDKLVLRVDDGNGPRWVALASR